MTGSKGKVEELWIKYSIATMVIKIKKELSRHLFKSL